MQMYSTTPGGMLVRVQPRPGLRPSFPQSCFSAATDPLHSCSVAVRERVEYLGRPGQAFRLLSNANRQYARIAVPFDPQHWRQIINRH